MSFTAFYSMYIFCQYITVYRLMCLSYYAPCCLLQSLQYLIAPHIVTSVCPLCSKSLCALLFSTFSALYVSTSFFHLSVLCYYVHCCLLPPVHSPSVRDTEVFVVSVSLYPLLFIYCLPTFCQNLI